MGKSKVANRRAKNCFDTGGAKFLYDHRNDILSIDPDTNPITSTLHISSDRCQQTHRFLFILLHCCGPPVCDCLSFLQGSITFHVSTLSFEMIFFRFPPTQCLYPDHVWTWNLFLTDMDLSERVFDLSEQTREFVK